MCLCNSASSKSWTLDRLFPLVKLGESEVLWSQYDNASGKSIISPSSCSLSYLHRLSLMILILLLLIKWKVKFHCSYSLLLEGAAAVCMEEGLYPDIHFMKQRL